MDINTSQWSAFSSIQALHENITMITNSHLNVAVRSAILEKSLEKRNGNAKWQTSVGNATDNELLDNIWFKNDPGASFKGWMNKHTSFKQDVLETFQITVSRQEVMNSFMNRLPNTSLAQAARPRTNVNHLKDFSFLCGQSGPKPSLDTWLQSCCLELEGSNIVW